MNMTPAETEKFIKELSPMVAGLDKCDIVLCVPAIDIPAAVAAAKGTNIKIGAENVHFKESGAYTGERLTLKMYKTGVLAVNYGGGIVFQLGIMEIKFMLVNLHQKVMVGFKTKTYLILGSQVHYGLSQL